MNYKFISNLIFINNRNYNKLPFIQCNIPLSKYVFDVLGYRLPNQRNRTYYILYYYQDNPVVIKGFISSIYDTWFCLTKISCNKIEEYDFLYAIDYYEQNLESNNGILYELTI